MQGKRWLILVIVAVVVIGGLWMWQQHNSGAWEARKALKSMKKTAQEWKDTETKTVFD